MHEALLTDREWLLTVPVDSNGKPLFDAQKADEFLTKVLPLTQLDQICSMRSTMALMEFDRQAYHYLYVEQRQQAEAETRGQKYQTKDSKQLIQKLNDIWWDTRERFMLEKRPEGKDAEKSGWTWLPH